MPFSYRLEHFLLAQAPIYPQVLIELEQGQKQTHWMRFIFPQLLGLSNSKKSLYYGLHNLEHAKAYLVHPILGHRLRECAALLEKHTDKTAHDIFGDIDELRLHASLTLFALASEHTSIYYRLLEQFFAGKMHLNTVEIHNS